MVFEDHGMSFPCTELLLFNYAMVNTVFHSMAPLITKNSRVHTTAITIQLMNDKTLTPNQNQSCYNELTNLKRQRSVCLE